MLCSLGCDEIKDETNQNIIDEIHLCNQVLIFLAKKQGKEDIKDEYLSNLIMSHFTSLSKDHFISFIEVRCHNLKNNKLQKKES